MNDGTLEPGMNNFGQLGLGDNSSRFAPESDLRLGGSKVKHVSCGGPTHSFALKTLQHFLCGSNSCGQLGINTLTDANEFQLVSLRTNQTLQT